MGLFNYLAALFLSLPLNMSGPMLYCIHRGEIEKAFESYMHYIQEGHDHDFLLLRHAARALLEKGIESKDRDIRLMCMFGAGVGSSSDLMHILEKGIKSDDLKTQLVALSYLAKEQDDEADRILLDAVSSPHLITRLEALLQLAKKNHPSVLNHLYSLVVKVPDPIRAAFAQIAIHLDNAESTRFLHKLLNDPNVDVRVETILAISSENRDDLLPHLHKLASSGSYTEQEAIAFAFATLKDLTSIDRLKIFAKSTHENVRLVALRSLYTLGETGYLQEIEEEAKKGSLFAIAILGEIQEGQEMLFHLVTRSKDRDIRLNAMIALLAMHDKRILESLSEILVEDARDVGFWRISTPASVLKAWKCIPGSKEQRKNYPTLISQTAALREKILTHCLEFEESDFLKIATMLVDRKQFALVPLLMTLLENKKSDAVIEFLKMGHQKTGNPLIRNYCTLSLYRLKERGLYEEQLISWIKACAHEDLIRFKQEEEAPTFTSPHQLTPEETSRFLVEVCETLASAQNQSGIEALIHAIAYGNPKNRYALAGLLLRTIE